MMNLAQLRVLLAVVDAGGIRPAADRIGRTPSAVSMTLKQLEGYLGGALFEGERKARLTRFGEFVHDQARSLVEHSERVSQAIDAFSHNGAGNVDVALLPSVAIAFLPDMLLHMGKLAPTVSVNVRDLDSTGVCEAVGRESVEIGIASYRPAPEISHEPLFSEPLRLVCHCEDPLCEYEGPIPWDMIASRPFIANGSYDTLPGLESLPIVNRHQLFVRSTISLLSVVQAGVGVTILPELSRLQAGDQIRFLPIDDPDSLRTVYILSRSDRKLSPAAECFAEIVKSTVEAQAERFGLQLLGR